MPNFIKLNSKNNDSLLNEALGLETLKQHINNHRVAHICIPKIIEVSRQKLELEYIPAQHGTNEQMRQLAVGLAQLHRVRHNHYGFQQDNFIGLSNQPNTISDNWGEFFWRYRLEFQVEKIGEAKLKEEFKQLLQFYKSKIVDFLTAHCELPSLVHGDLWSGNVMFSKSKIWLIDPAVYYADREVDIAMTEMFDSFSPVFYQTYNQHFSLSEQYPIKRNIYNLYHYLNHYNLFGSSYLNGCRQGFNTIVEL